MAGLFSRIKTWVSLEDVTYSDLNAEFDNVITNFVPLMMDDYSTNATQMRVQTDPGESGSESLATTLAGELARLRFVINEMKGTTYWYTSANTSLNEIANVVGGGIPANRISSGKTSADSDAPAFLVPNGAARTITLDVTPTPFVYYIAGIQYSISTTDVSVTSLTAAPSSNNTALVNMAGLNDQGYSKYLGEYDSVITIDNIGSEVSSLNGKLAGFKINNGSADEYFLAYVDTTNNQLKNIIRGAFINSSSAAVERIAFADNDTITLMKLTWVFAKTDGTLAITYTNPRVSYTEPSSPSIGDYWYDLANSLWKTYNGSSFVSATATLIGICLQDATNTVAARSFNTFRSYSEQNTVRLVKNSATEIRSSELGAEVSVFGNAIKFEKDYVRWNAATDFESGVTEAASTLYYLYITEDGAPKISDKHPHDRRSDLKGLYHPNESWRCVGQVFNDAGSNFVNPQDYVTDYANPIQLTTGVGSNALTVTIAAPLAKKITFPAVSSDTVNQRTILGPQAVTVSSGSTLGHVDALAGNIYVHGLDAGSGIIDLGVSSKLFDEGALQSSTAEGGAGAADSSLLLYSTVARTNVPVRVFGRLTSTQTTAGTWASAMSEISPAPFKQATVTASYHLSANFSASTTIPVNFDTKEEDSHNAVTTSATAWMFKAPVSGIYLVAGPLLGSSNAAIIVYKGGSAFKNAGHCDGASGIRGHFLTTVPLLKGEYIDIRPSAASTITGGTKQTTGVTNINITLVGDYAT